MAAGKDVTGVNGAGRSRVTIADVAERSGVGLSTVSRVIRGASGVSPATRERVQAAVIETGYRADGVARSLRSSQNLGLVVLMVPDIGDPYFADTYLRLQDLTLGIGESLLLGCHLESVDLQRDLLHQMGMNRPATIVLVPAPGTTLSDIQAIRSGGSSVVILDRPVAGSHEDCVLSANEEGAQLLVDQLDPQPDARVAIVSLPRGIWTQDRRVEATRRALSRRGLSPVLEIEQPARTAPTSDAFLPIFEQEIDTVLSMSIPPAMGVLRLEKLRGTPIPHFGCFDTHPWFDLGHRDIVRVTQAPLQVATEVMRLIERRRDDPDASIEASVEPFRLDEPERDSRQTQNSFFNEEIQ